MVHDEGQVNEVNSKGVPWDLIKVSNSKKNTKKKDDMENMECGHLKA